MKKSKIKKTIQFLLFTVFIVGVGTHMFAQENQSTDLKDFEIIIEQADRVIKMKCVKGCAWNELSFGITYYDTKSVDEFGMTETNKNSSIIDENLANFLFNLKITINGIKLEGVEGTAWTDLSFPLSKKDKQKINQFGMSLTKD